jgi:hypothetical protein
LGDEGRRRTGLEEEGIGGGGWLVRRGRLEEAAGWADRFHPAFIPRLKEATQRVYFCNAGELFSL